ncbi:MAG: hypothetical protein R3E97_07760 [Candidatus Eisenbacteria bacterium]
MARWHEEAPAKQAKGDGESDPVPTQAGIDYLRRFFGEGKGLTNLVYFVDAAQVLDEIGTVQSRWIAEYGLGEKGSPRYVSGRVALTFLQHEGAWALRGWLGSRGQHHAVEGSHRTEDVQAIREQILRVFEAYRQKDIAMLRRTHTADWRGFTLSSPSIGRGIDAYIQAAEARSDRRSSRSIRSWTSLRSSTGTSPSCPTWRGSRGRTVRGGRRPIVCASSTSTCGSRWVGIRSRRTRALHPEELIGG